MRFSVLGSGSSGNVSYVESDEARILVDAGLSCKEIERRLALINVDANDIDALIITHEHIDHVRGAGVFARRYGVPLFVNKGTFSRCRKILGNVPTPLFFNTGDTLTFKDTRVHFITKCHDAADPVALTLSSNGCKLGFVTDLGRPTSLILDSFQGCDALILEFNHDTEMLSCGPYPIDLKRRIWGPEGHLSNDQAAQLLAETIHEKLSVLVLAHLSEVNNTEQLAYNEAKKVIKTKGFEATALIVSKQKEVTPLVSVHT